MSENKVNIQNNHRKVKCLTCGQVLGEWKYHWSLVRAEKRPLELYFCRKHYKDMLELMDVMCRIGIKGLEKGIRGMESGLGGIISAYKKEAKHDRRKGKRSA